MIIGIKPFWFCLLVIILMLILTDNYKHKRL
jgi:hypothetical protein